MAFYLCDDILYKIGIIIREVRDREAMDFHIARYQLTTYNGEDRWYLPIASDSWKLWRRYRLKNNIITHRENILYLKKYLGDGRRKWVKDKNGYYGKPNPWHRPRTHPSGEQSGKIMKPYGGPMILPITTFY